jgi:hypothetical protein
MQIQYVLTPYFYVVQFQPPVVATALKNHTLQQHCILEDFGGADKVSLTNVWNQHPTGLLWNQLLVTRS